MSLNNHVVLIDHWQAILSNAEPASPCSEQASPRYGACFNQHDGLPDRATDHCPMIFAHSRMVRRPVRRSVMLMEKTPRTSQSLLRTGKFPLRKSQSLLRKSQSLLRTSYSLLQTGHSLRRMGQSPGRDRTDSPRQHSSDESHLPGSTENFQSSVKLARILLRKTTCSVATSPDMGVMEKSSGAHVSLLSCLCYCYINVCGASFFYTQAYKLSVLISYELHGGNNACLTNLYSQWNVQQSHA